MSECTCMHEDQIQGQSRKIAELEAKHDYKELTIQELKTDMKELKKSIDSLDKTINNYILKSVEDDNTLKEVINQQNQRITALESELSTIYKLIVIVPTIITIIGIIVKSQF